MIFREHRREDQDDAKLRGPELVEVAAASVEQRLPSDIGTRMAGPGPVPRYMLEPLKSYPRLRDLVEAYLTVQDRIPKYEEIRNDLDAAGDKPAREFWAKVHRELGPGGLRADVSDELLTDAKFERLVATFDAQHGTARTAALAGRNPHQSAESAQVVYEAVNAILDAADNLSIECKDEAKKLLKELYNAVNKIFSDEEDELLPPELRVTERSTFAAPVEAVDQLAPSVRGLAVKQLTSDAPERSFDFETHLFTKRGER